MNQNQKNEKMIHEHAFYESGLSAHGCLENLDSYAITAIEKYGRILLQNQKQSYDEEIKKYKEHLAHANDDYIKILSDYAKLDDETRVEIQDLEAQLKSIKESPLEKELADTALLKSQITHLYSILSKTDALWNQSEAKQRKWREIAKKLYSVTLHVEELAKSRCNIIVVGPGLYSEAVNSIKEYEELENNNGL